MVPSTTQSGDALAAPRWLSSLSPVRFIPLRRDDYSVVRVRYRKYRLQVLLSYHGPAYLDEGFTVEINVTNDDDRELDIVVDALLQPTEIDEAGQSACPSDHGDDAC